MSRSKKLVTHNSRTNPAGSYDTISRWIFDQATDEIKLPNGVVRGVFENEQVRLTVKCCVKIGQKVT